jgi:hypothetical protein
LHEEDLELNRDTSRLKWLQLIKFNKKDGVVRDLVPRGNIDLELPCPCDIEEKVPSISPYPNTNFVIIARLTLNQTRRITGRNQGLSAG